MYKGVLYLFFIVIIATVYVFTAFKETFYAYL